MKTKTKITFSLIILIFSIISCKKDPIPVAEPEDIVLTQKSMQLVNAGNTFTFNLLKKIPIIQGQNMMVSPLSISLALSMALNGAEASTKTDMINTLGLTGLTVDEVNQIYLDLITALKKVDPNVVMNVANSIWIRKNYPVEETFITTNQKYFDATVTKLDFDQTGLNTINSWVNEKTNSKIPKILDVISSDEIMFLINAIYFNGKWHYQFDKTLTQNGMFTLGSGSAANVPYMKIKEQFGYSEQSGYEALKMPYGRGKFGMVIILPDEGKTPDQIIELMTPATWATLNTSLNTPVKVDVWMPRFKFAWETELKEILSSLGMSLAFSPSNANFSKINALDRLYITKAKHKTFIEVNEEGTEAAAVTSIGIGVTSIGPGGPEFHATRPFLFFITEEDTDAVIFAGKVENPLN